MKRSILLLLFPLLAFADPGAAMRYLINEPASLMDLGLVRLDIRLAEYRETIGPNIDELAKTDLHGYSFSSTYNADKEEISVRLWILPKDSSQAVAACQNLLPIVRSPVEHGIRTLFFHADSPSSNDQPEPLALLAESSLYCVTTDSYSSKEEVSVHIGFDSYDMTVTIHGDNE